ncbi:hypothetical protein GLYMA_10G042201v4 [Glycine max]|nr:hypothetical protein GLYMA_10G042201v4 [Glycine max]KAH1136675.1 hypothetical protein GYH30_026924 [Glycine max]
MLLFLLLCVSSSPIHLLLFQSRESYMLTITIWIPFSFQTPSNPKYPKPLKKELVSQRQNTPLDKPSEGERDHSTS